MLDARAIGNTIGKNIVAMRKAQAPALTLPTSVPAPVVNVAPPIVNVTTPDVVVNVAPAAVAAPIIEIQAAAAALPPIVNVTTPEVVVNVAPAPVQSVPAPVVNVAPPIVNVTTPEVVVNVDLSSIAAAIATLTKVVAENNAAMFAQADALTALAAAMTAPRSLVLDNTGKPVGIKFDKIKG